MRHRFAAGNLWQRIAGQILPAKYARKYPTLYYNETNDGPTMIAWIEQKDPKIYDVANCRIFDDSGTELWGYDMASSRLDSKTGRGLIRAFVFNVLPSGSREIHLGFHRTNSIQKLGGEAVFTVRNPGYRPSETGRTVYPVMLTKDRLTLTLQSFGPTAGRDERSEMGMAFDVFENGKPAPNWELHSLEVKDPNGAVYRSGMAGWTRRGNHTDMLFGGWLGTNTPWRLRFELKHVGFESNELCTVTNLAMPAGGKTPVRVPFNGTTLVIDVSRDVFYSNLKARLEPADENYYMDLVGVPKVNGGPYDNGKRFGGGSSDTNCDFGFPGEVTNVDLVFGITRKVFIEGTVWGRGK